jgi:hypothetical protein
MIGNLAEAIDTLLTASLPGLIGTDPGEVAVAVARPVFEIDPTSADALAGAPRPDDARDTLPFDPAAPGGPYVLSQPPYPGTRRVYLENSAGERIALTPAEVIWDDVDPQQFTLALKAHRDPAGLDQLTVLYSVTRIVTTIKATSTVEVVLSGSDPDNLRAAETLAISVLQLNRDALRADAAADFSDGVYSAETAIKKLLVTRGAAPLAGSVSISLAAEAEVKVRRALEADEGATIQRIASPGATPDPNRPVHIDPLVEA